MPQPTPANPILVREKEVMGLIHGSTPDSINEWYVSQALDKLDIYYMYQFAIEGGRAMRGGQVIDFLVQVGGWLPVFVNGTYWHDIRNDPELPLRLEAARHQFHREPVVLREEDTNTKEKALAIVKKEILA